MNGPRLKPISPSTSITASTPITSEVMLRSSDPTVSARCRRRSVTVPASVPLLRRSFSGRSTAGVSLSAVERTSRSIARNSSHRIPNASRMIRMMWSGLTMIASRLSATN
jgi:hypothetical protein